MGAAARWRRIAAAPPSGADRARRPRSRIRTSPIFASRRLAPTAPAVVISRPPDSRPRACLTRSSGLPTKSLSVSRRIDPYLQSHPLPAERVGRSKISSVPVRIGTRRTRPHFRHVTIWPAPSSSASSVARSIAHRYPVGDNSLAARYARTIAIVPLRHVRASLKQVDELIRREPERPYFSKLKGQTLLEDGRAADAVAPLRNAVPLAPTPRSS